MVAIASDICRFSNTHHFDDKIVLIRVYERKSCVVRVSPQFTAISIFGGVRLFSSLLLSVFTPSRSYQHSSAEHSEGEVEGAGLRDLRHRGRTNAATFATTVDVGAFRGDACCYGCAAKQHPHGLESRRVDPGI